MNEYDDKTDSKTELAPEYNGLSGEHTAETEAPAPLAEDNIQPVFKPKTAAEEIKIPEEAKNYDTAEKLRWLFLIILLAAPFVAAVVCLFLDKKIPAMVCVGCFVIIVPAFFVIYLIKERNALIGKGIVGKIDTRQIEAEVVSCIYVTRKYREHKVRGAGTVRELVDVTYKTVITDGRNKYVAKTKIFYYPREEVNAYVRKNRAYIDINDPKNKREVNSDD